MDIKNVVRNVKTVVVNKKTAVGVSLMVAAGSASAEGVDIAGAISSAITSGQTNVSTVVAGLIGMAALAFGVTMIVGFLRK